MGIHTPELKPLSISSIVERFIMKLILIFLSALVYSIQRCHGDSNCTDVTISGCDVQDGTLIVTVDSLDVIMCQQFCQKYQTCKFFRFDHNSTSQNCGLFESNYRESCKRVAAPIHRNVNDCLTSPDETCENMIGENCTLQGDAIHTTPSGSVLDANQCNALCELYERYNCSHWQFDKVEMQCSLYDSKEADCASISGPQFPNIEECKKNVLVSGAHPQNKYVSEYCLSKATYSRHVCGNGATEWEGDGEVQYGPYSEDAYLSSGGEHCSRNCNCNEIKVECLL